MTQHLYNGVLFSMIMLFSDIGQTYYLKIFLGSFHLQTMAITKSGERKRDILSMSVSVAS